MEVKKKTIRRNCEEKKRGMEKESTLYEIKKREWNKLKEEDKFKEDLNKKKIWKVKVDEDLREKVKKAKRIKDKKRKKKTEETI